MRWTFRPIGELPWGYDMDVERHGRTWFLKDPDGNTHETIRDLFSAWRLHACVCHAEADLEHMRQTLHAVEDDLLRMDRSLLVKDLFDGSAQFQRTMYQWMEGTGFTMHDIVGDQPDPDTMNLTPEGAAVMRMLDETRSGSNVDTSPPAIRERFMDEMEQVYGKGGVSQALFRHRHAMAGR